MKITIEVDGKEQVFDEVTDYYLAVRQYKPVASKTDDTIALLPNVRSYSNGDLRELVKEIIQSSVEMQEMLKGVRDANTRAV